MQPCAGKGGFPGAIRPKKECIKSSETYFANTLNLNDKGPSMKWVCFPKFYDPLAIWPWLRISPHSSLNVIYYLILAAWQWLMSFTYMPCIPMQIKPNKCLSRQGMGQALSFTERVVVLSLCHHRISVVPVNLSVSSIMPWTLWAVVCLRNRFSFWHRGLQWLATFPLTVSPQFWGQDTYIKF